MVNQDPWADKSSSPQHQHSEQIHCEEDVASQIDNHYRVYFFVSTELQLPPKPLNYLKSVHLLAKMVNKPKPDDSLQDMQDIALLFQYGDGNMWSISLSQ